MTNAEKYLKEGVSVEEYCKAIDNYIKGNGYSGRISEEFLNAPVQPTLTEDERVILRNIDTFVVERIGRNKESHLYLWIGEENKHIFVGFDKLFQFIKERRRIRDKRIVRR